jgi:hypothetical protein
VSDLLWRSANKVTIHPEAVKTSTIMLSKVTFDATGIHGNPCGSGMGITPGEGRKLPMRVSFNGKGWVSGPGFTPAGKPVKGAMTALIEDGKVTVAYSH